MSTHHTPIRLVLILLGAACAPSGRGAGAVVLDTGVPGLLPSAWDTGTVTAAGVHVPIECPGLYPKPDANTRSAARRDPTGAARLAASMQHVPKYHDCQRLVIGNSADAYGPLVAIFALESLRPIDAAALSQPGGVPVALIRNLSSREYQRLAIKPRFSCLHLRMPTPGEFEALMEWRDADSTCAALPVADWQKQGNVRLRADSIRPSSDGAHYPSVARWDRDRPNGQHYIGIKCLDAWCEISRTPVDPSANHPNLGNTGTVKGWYDEQRLAEVTTNPPAMNPGVRAWIVPVPRLDTLRIRHFSCDYPCAEQAGWVHVSTAWLERESRFYKDRMNLEEGSGGNVIHARRQVKTTGDERWESRITSASGEVRYYLTWRMPHADGAFVPPIARWLWRDDDETSWFRCDVGCCETSQERIMDIRAPW